MISNDYFAFKVLLTSLYFFSYGLSYNVFEEAALHHLPAGASPVHYCQNLIRRQDSGTQSNTKETSSVHPGNSAPLRPRQDPLKRVHRSHRLFPRL